MSVTFNDRDYTADALIKQLSLIELHGKDGSAVDSGCACIESKHLFMIEGLAEEGVGFGVSTKEKAFYRQVSEFARVLRKNIDAAQFTFPKIACSTVIHAGNPYSDCKARRERCITKLKGHKGINAFAVCSAAVKCPQK